MPIQAQALLLVGLLISGYGHASGYRAVGWEHGAGGYESVRREAQRTHRPMIVYFNTEWCTWCRRFNQEYLRHQELQPTAQLQDANGTYFVHADHLQTPRLATNSAAQIVWRSRHEAFGKATVENDPDGNGATINLNIRFPGQYFDAETGLHYNYFRDYDSNIGRYVQSDPIGIAGGINIYLYAAGAPLSLTDAFGLAPPTVIPPDASPGRNVQDARNMKIPGSFANRVKPGGSWDYKSQNPKYEPFGNYNYGAAGRAAGYSAETLRRAAGLIQKLTKTSKEEWHSPLGKPPYGDEPYDQHWVDEGIKDYDSGKYDHACYKTE